MKKVTVAVDIEVPDDYTGPEILEHFVRWLADARFYNVEAWHCALSPEAHYPNEAWKKATIDIYKQNSREIQQAIQTVRIV